MVPFITSSFNPTDWSSRHKNDGGLKEKSETTDQSESSSRRSFASNLFDLAFSRNEKRYRRSDSATNLNSSCSTTSSTDSRRYGLSHLPESELIKCIEPILSQLQELDAEELLSLTRVSSGGAPLRDGLYVRPIHTEIVPTADSLEDDTYSCPKQEPATPVVRYIHLKEVPDQYSMGIFVFPPNARIPLHDHPGMCVISRVLYGEVNRRSLDLPSDGSVETPTSPETRRRAYFRTLRQTKPSSYNRNDSSTSSCADPASDATSSSVLLKIPTETIVAPYCTVLFPHVGNLHEFTAGPNGAAVLDVLLPPYDADHHRDCTFYDIVEDYDEDNVAAHVASTTTKNIATDKPDGITSQALTTDDGYISHPCWIIPIDRPEDFHCLSGQYRTLGG